MRTLAALMLVALVATTALGQPDSPAEKADARGPKDGAQGGGDHGKGHGKPDAPKQPHSADDPTDVEALGNKTQRYLPQVFFNVTAAEENSTTEGDVHVREMFVHAEAEWNVTQQNATALPDPDGNATAGTDPVNRTTPPPPPPINGTPRISISIDLPSTANPGEMLLVTLRVDVEGSGNVSNVTVRAAIPDGYTILPSHGHSAWNGGALEWHLDEVHGDASVFFHVVAPVRDAASSGVFMASADGAGQTALAAHMITVLPASQPSPSYVPRTAQVAAGYVSTLTAVPGV